MLHWLKAALQEKLRKKEESVKSTNRENHPSKNNVNRITEP